MLFVEIRWLWAFFLFSIHVINIWLDSISLSRIKFTVSLLHTVVAESQWLQAVFPFSLHVSLVDQMYCQFVTYSSTSVITEFSIYLMMFSESQWLRAVFLFSLHVINIWLDSRSLRQIKCTASLLHMVVHHWILYLFNEACRKLMAMSDFTFFITCN